MVSDQLISKGKEESKNCEAEVKKQNLTNRRIELSLGVTVNVGDHEFVKPTVGMAADIEDGASAQTAYLELASEIMTQLRAMHALASTGKLTQLLKQMG